MAKIRHSKKNYTQVSNIVLNDKNISLKAKGLFAFMDSKPDGWNFTIASMAQQLKEGEDAIKSAMRELKDAGYMKYHRLNTGHGIYELIDDPEAEEPQVENPHVENPQRGNATRISNKEPIAIKINNNPPISPKEEIYEYYKQHIKASKAKQQSLNNISQWLKTYTKEELIKAIDNYKPVAESQTDQKFIKECRNFFGVARESRGYFIDYIQGTPTGTIKDQKPERLWR